jgi:hypothetical protein
LRITKLLILTAALLPAACGDPFGPRHWSDAPATAVLHSATRAELVGLPSAFDFIELRALPIEAPGVTGLWDVMLIDHEGALAFVPAGWLDGLESIRSAIAPVPAQTLEEVTVAPRDTSAWHRVPVPIVPGTVYVIRTRRGICGFGTTGVRYAKVLPIDIDAALGRVTFEFVRNPYCDDRALVPPAN